MLSCTVHPRSDCLRDERRKHIAAQLLWAICSSRTLRTCTGGRRVIYMHIYREILHIFVNEYLKQHARTLSSTAAYAETPSTGDYKVSAHMMAALLSRLPNAPGWNLSTRKPRHNLIEKVLHATQIMRFKWACFSRSCTCSAKGFRMLIKCSCTNLGRRCP